jgi:D-sedoheptulose 7-phosphate isomerase
MKREDFVNRYFQEFDSITKQISRKDINNVIEILHEAWKEEKQVFLAGNGGSASTAIHFASDLAKFTSVNGKKRFRSISLNDNIPLISALTNDLGWENVYVEQLMNLMQRGDVFVPISVHGGSGALEGSQVCEREWRKSCGLGWLRRWCIEADGRRVHSRSHKFNITR